MDMRKIGTLLRTLRNEKGLTQSELAEHLNVSNRTVSRWETGTNLPDIDMLMLLANFYTVDLSELLDGERRSVDMENDRETVEKLADYSTHRERILICKTLMIVGVGMLAWGASLVTLFGFAEVTGGIVSVFADTLAGLILYALAALTRRVNRTVEGYLNLLIGGFSAVTVGNIAIIAVFFRSGSYFNYGLIGIYYSLGMMLAAFAIAAAVVTLVNWRNWSHR